MKNRHRIPIDNKKFAFFEKCCEMSRELKVIAMPRWDLPRNFVYLCIVKIDDSLKILGVFTSFYSANV